MSLLSAVSTVHIFTTFLKWKLSWLKKTQKSGIIYRYKIIKKTQFGG